jgi:transposase-like protein
VTQSLLNADENIIENSSNKIKRTYALRIDNYSSKALRAIFEKHISKEANITTDEWTGYKPITKDFNIRQIPSNNGTNFKQLHHVVHQIKSWIRTTYSWTHEYHIDKYLDEYSFRINRSIHKDIIFHKLVSRLVFANSIEYKNVIIVTK